MGNRDNQMFRSKLFTISCAERVADGHLPELEMSIGTPNKIHKYVPASNDTHGAMPNSQSFIVATSFLGLWAVYCLKIYNKFHN